MRHAQIWAYCILMTSAISIYGHKRAQGLTPTEIQLSRATDLATMPIYGHVGNDATGHQDRRAVDKALLRMHATLEHENQQA